MKVSRKTYGHDFERIKIRVNKAVTIFVDVFEVPEGYKCASFNDVIHHDHLDGYAFHKSKGRSIKMAVRELRQLMVECDKSWLED
jgi:hypothetical protein